MIKVTNIVTISKVSYVGPVYNLELDSICKEDDLFWVEGTTGIVNHNCLPKDLDAMRTLGRAIQVPTWVLDAVVDRNNNIDRT